MTYTPPNWTDPFTVALAVAGLVLIAVQGWLIFRNQALPTSRKALRATLNGLLWLVVVGYVLQISWPANRPATHALLVGGDVPAAYVRTVQDSLHIRERFTAKALKNTDDSVTLIGQDFPVETLTRLSQSVVHWIPYNQPGRVQELRWKGVVRQGEMQRVTGQIQSAGRQLLRVQYGNQTLDSLLLTPGSNAFRLQFPVFGRGRIQTELVLGEQVLDTVRFYGRPTTPLLVQFVLDNPDFESKTLADWLSRQGHSVQVSTTLAKNIRSSTVINGSLKATGYKPDVVITDPANATNAIVRRTIADGKAVLFINLSNPPADVSVINQALKTRWQVKKVSDQKTVPAASGLTAYPYQFRNSLNQFAVPGYPVAMQQGAGRVSVSLLNETFPLALSGDSVAYNRVWYAIMAQLQPAEQNNVTVDAPVFSGLSGRLFVNNRVVGNSMLRVGTDTVRLTNSALNQRSASGILLTKQVGWQSLGDSLAVYVENTPNRSPVASRQMVSRFVLAHSKYQPATTSSAYQTHEPSPGETIPGWAWLILFLVCLTALWIEPKIS